MVFYPLSKMVHISFASFKELRKPLSSDGCLLPHIVLVFSRILCYEKILFHECHNRSFVLHFWWWAYFSIKSYRTLMSSNGHGIFLLFKYKTRNDPLGAFAFPWLQDHHFGSWIKPHSLSLSINLNISFTFVSLKHWCAFGNSILPWTFAIHVYFPSQPLSIIDYFRGFLRSSTFSIGVYL